MKLIVETNFDSVKNLTEASADGGKSYWIEGIFLQAEVKNRNGRIYPQNVLFTEARNYTVKYIETNAALGELGHPTNPDINLHLASHIVKEFRFDGNDIIGRAKIITSVPNGAIAKGLMEEGVRFGVSSRGLGSLKFDESQKANVVQSDFTLTAIDIVHDPSAPEAFVNGIMENREWIYESGAFKEVDIAKVKKSLNQKMIRKNREAKILEGFNRLMKNISQRTK